MQILRLGIFADVSNIYFCVREKYKRKINYEYLLKNTARDQNLIRSIAYGIETTDVSAFKKCLSDIGWELKFKNSKAFSDGSKKADQDVNIAMDIVRMIDMLDKVVLCTADGDFASLLQWCKEKGRSTLVIGCGISHELKSVADQCIEIGEEYLEHIAAPTDSLVVRSDGICHVHRNTSK